MQSTEHFWSSTAKQCCSSSIIEVPKSPQIHKWFEKMLTIPWSCFQACKPTSGHANFFSLAATKMILAWNRLSGDFNVFYTFWNKSPSTWVVAAKLLHFEASEMFNRLQSPAFHRHKSHFEMILSYSKTRLERIFNFSVWHLWPEWVVCQAANLLPFWMFLLLITKTKSQQKAAACQDVHNADVKTLPTHLAALYCKKKEKRKE